MNKNTGYVHEITAMVITAERNGETASSAVEAALRNGVTDDQLVEAKQRLLSQPEASHDALLDYVHQLYVSHGIEQGYVSPSDETTHTTWVLGQLANNHYGE